MEQDTEDKIIMEQYISKSALVAEIEKLRKNAWDSFQKGNSTEKQYYLRYGVILDILSFIDTLEVKEVDFDEDIETKFNIQLWKYSMFSRFSKLHNQSS